MARPKKDPLERRTDRVELRLTLAERVALEFHANALGISVAEYVRRRALGERLPGAPERRADPALVHQVHRVGAGLHEMLKDARLSGQVDRGAIASALEKIDKLTDLALAEAGLSHGPARN